MKILLINKFHYYKGGSETYYFGLADLLRKRGHQVIFFSMKDERNVPCEQEKYFVENVDYNGKLTKKQMVHEGLKMLYSFEAKKKLEQLIEEEKPDVAHINLFQSQLTGSIIDVLYKHHIPMVYTAHDLKVICPTYLFMCRGEICRECMYGNYLSCIRKKCMKDSLAKSLLAVMEAEVYRIHHTYNKIDLILAPSDHHKKYLAESKATKTPIIRMRNFLPETVRPVAEVKAGTYFLYFGRISQEKGVYTLVCAYAMSGMSTPLYLVGSGPLEEDVKKLIEDLHMQEQIHMLGYKRGAELTQIVEGAKCVLLPSECCENAPYSILEAMAAGRPAIVANNGGLPEIVQAGKTGFIAEPRNPENLAHTMQQVDALTEEQLVQMGRNAQELVKQIADPEKYVSRMEQIYTRLLKRKHNYRKSK